TSGGRLRPNTLRRDSTGSRHFLNRRNERMRMRVACVALACLFLVPRLNAEDANPRWKQVIGLQTKRENETKFASGFLVKKGDDVFLVTAKHASRETNGNTRLLYVTPEGESRWYLMRGLFSAGKDPWTEHGHADVAIAKLSPPQQTEETLKVMRNVAIDFQTIAKVIPGRTTPIELVGFPMALGVGPKMSALVIPGHVVSKELTKQGDWGTTPIVYAVPAVGAGASGSPAYDVSVNPAVVIGVYVAVTKDITGAKLSEFVPSRLVREIIEAW
ncbi:MAG: hypothetical protein AAGJ83_15825, partial [Planctomycetota bacterium]